MDPIEELSGLMDALRDGTIEDAQVARLDQLLAEHPEALERFVDRAWLQSDLEHQLGRAPVAAMPKKRRMGIPFAAAAAILIAGLVVLLRPAEPASLSYEGCAVLSRAVEPKWEGSAPAVGSVLPKGRIALASGSIQVEFFSGARVILEGPVDFDLVATNEGFCRHGKLRAFIPPQAEGFTVRTPSLKLVDRGTEFGLRLGRGGDAEVHVFQGLVEVESPGSKHELQIGKAIRVSGGAIESIAADPEAFLTLSELTLRSTEEARDRYARWGTASDRLRRDSRVALYYSFEDAPSWSRELRCQRPERSPLDGAIIGARWAEGRWSGKKALEFKGPGDRVRFQDAGEYESLTLMTWVRVDAIDRPFSGLMLTDGWGTAGSVHWQITQKGKIRLGIHGTGQSFDYDTPVIFEPAQLGRWINLCTVYDRPAREVVHYVDGRAMQRLPLRFDTVLRLGNVELGNWGVPLQGNIYGIRHLNGRMDEFALFGTALKEDEVRAHYLIGAPAP